MNIAAKKKIVLLGMMSRLPVAGVVWQTLHYLIGFERLGYEVYYVEAHAMTPSKLMERKDDDGSVKAAAFIESVMNRFDMSGRWAFHALHADGRCYGMSESCLRQLYSSADLLINYHGGTVPRHEHSETGRLIYVETDPVELQIELYNHNQDAIDFLAPHRAFFTYGEAYGKPECKLPVYAGFQFQPTRQPVVIDFWRPYSNESGSIFTTVGNWRQGERQVRFQGAVYHWSKHYEFMKYLDLPLRAGAQFELALSSLKETDKQMLEGKGWKVRCALDFSTDIDAYRSYIAQSRGEFTVAKDQNIRLRTGWFSDRSATYLASSKPVITQETGFSGIIPTGEGLFGFSTMKDVLNAVECINSDYKRHSKAAAQIAREYFGHEVVLKSLLDRAGV